MFLSVKLTPKAQNRGYVLTLQKGKKFTVITAYDALFARLIAPYADLILVGDSLAMSFGGQADTLSVGMDEMIYHTKAVGMGAPNSKIIFDMPFGSETDKETALKNAARVYKETKACMVKIEGGIEKVGIVEHLVKNKISVISHIGLMPQSARAEGGFKIKGKSDEDIERLIGEAKAMEAVGASAILLEGVKSEAGKKITESISIPTIGIGAGADCDAQVLVWSDMLGFFEEFTPKFVRKYMDGATLAKSAFENFANDVKNGNFPNKNESY